ncbi:hypothetical protein T439DRAFT_325042 [Meredithblackwellia eburnea MCA 4105]
MGNSKGPLLLLLLLTLLHKLIASPFQQQPFQVSPKLPVLRNNKAIRFDTDGSQLDAHDGKIYYAKEEQVYVLVGAAYSCGFVWNSRYRSWCGVTMYSSKDLISWKSHGVVMEWQKERPEHGFRPKMAYNEKTKKWLLFWNVHNIYYPQLGLEIWSSSTGVFGPYKFASRPELYSTPNDFSVGVHPHTGKAYLLYGYNLADDLTIEEMDDEYLGVTGKRMSLPYKNQEGWDMQWREDRGEFYIIYGICCAYCNGTDTTFIRGTDPLDAKNWTTPQRISMDSCGGQPSFLASLPNIHGGETLLYGSDLWDNGHPNEAKALMYWEPLKINEDGSLPNLTCKPDHELDILHLPSSAAEEEVQRKREKGGPTDPNVDQSSGDEGFKWKCDTPNPLEMESGQHLQTWTVGKDGIMTEVGFSASRMHTDGQLNADVFQFGPYDEVFDSANWVNPPNLGGIVMPMIARRVIMPDEMDWGIKNYKIDLRIPVKKGWRFLLMLGTYGSTNQFCFAIRDVESGWRNETSPRMHAYRYGTAGGTLKYDFKWVPDDKELKFYSIVE